MSTSCRCSSWALLDSKALRASSENSNPAPVAEWLAPNFETARLRRRIFQPTHQTESKIVRIDLKRLANILERKYMVISGAQYPGFCFSIQHAVPATIAVVIFFKTLNGVVQHREHEFLLCCARRLCTERAEILKRRVGIEAKDRRGC